MPIVSGQSTATSVPKILERGKLAFVVALQQGFASSVADKNLRYSQDETQTKLKIWTAHPLTQEFYPAVVVSTAGTDASFQFLSDDFVEERVSEAKVIFAGRAVFTLSLTILSRSTLERERIMDHLIFFVRHLFRDTLHGLGVEYTRDIRVGPEELEEVENHPVYRQVIDIPCYMEFEAEVDQSAFSTIKELCINIDGINSAQFDPNTP